MHNISVVYVPFLIDMKIEQIFTISENLIRDQYVFEEGWLIYLLIQTKKKQKKKTVLSKKWCG